jgi:cellobiose-specific phosphotransferase system component IIA
MARAAAALVIAGLVFGLPARAAEAQAKTPTATQQSRQQQFEKVRQQMLQAQKKLTDIQRATLKANPDLQHKQEAFSDMLLKEMDKQGHHSKKEVAELKAMAIKLRDKNTPDAERQTLATTFRKKVEAFQAAQRKALESPTMQKARKDLGEAIFTAMKKHDPNTEKLVAQIKQNQADLMRIQQAAQQGK